MFKVVYLTIKKKKSGKWIPFSCTVGVEWVPVMDIINLNSMIIIIIALIMTLYMKTDYEDRRGFQPNH